MRITATVKKRAFLAVAACLVLSLSGCIDREPVLERARKEAARSRESYDAAVKAYTGLIAKNNGSDSLYFELGSLYYQGGDFEAAVDAFARSADERAPKFLALSHFKAGNFQEALAIFDQGKCRDDECLYYYGLTCEKLHLFDQALGAYRAIKKQDRFFARAHERIGIIGRDTGESVGINQASPETAGLIARAPGQEEYPQAGALILSCEESIEVGADNTQVATLHYIIKILNERGKEDFSESHLEYDSTYERVDLEYARTIRPDGIIVDVGSRHIRDVSKYLNFPLYSNVRVFIISFPEISEGAIVEYKVRVRRNKLINEKDTVLSYPLESSEPILRAKFLVSVPKDRPLSLKTINAGYNTSAQALEPSVSSDEKRITYRWEFSGIPQIIPESNMPPDVEINPTILASTFTDWQQVYRWWWALARDKIAADPSIKAKVRELTGARMAPEEKARAIYNFCAQKIRYVAVEYGQAGYEPHRAEDIFRNKYGDCKDQAILLVAMLKEAGLNAWPVLISTRSYYNLRDDFPSVLFNHCIAVVEIGSKTVFLDPTAETCPFGDLPVDDQDRAVLVFREDGFRIQRTPTFAAEHNLVRQELSIRINDDESIAGKKAVTTKGMYEQAQRYWLLYTPPELIEQALKEKIQDISIGARLESFSAEKQGDLDQPVILRYAFSGPEYLTGAGNLRIMPQLVSFDSSLVAKDARRYPLDLALLDTKETVFEVETPQGFAIRYLPENVQEESPWFSLRVTYEKNKDRIRVLQKIALKKSFITQDEYPEFKARFESLATRLKQRIIFERSPQ
ncbi:MAG: DUF3857 domain-containing protein [Candidatus Omnitrophica bacterium]|nr:DUF3857 domain-containing protein [Candidatus Omnitrophota bacterium]